MPRKEKTMKYLPCLTAAVLFSAVVFASAAQAADAFDNDFAAFKAKVAAAKASGAGGDAVIKPMGIPAATQPLAANGVSPLAPNAGKVLPGAVVPGNPLGPAANLPIKGTGSRNRQRPDADVA